MGTEDGFCKHEKVSNSLVFSPDKSAEQNSSWLHMFIADISYSSAMEAGTLLTQLFYFVSFSCKLALLGFFFFF